MVLEILVGFLSLACIFLLFDSNSYKRDLDRNRRRYGSRVSELAKDKNEALKLARDNSLIINDLEQKLKKAQEQASRGQEFYDRNRAEIKVLNNTIKSLESELSETKEKLILKTDELNKLQESSSFTINALKSDIAVLQEVTLVKPDTKNMTKTQPVTKETLMKEFKITGLFINTFLQLGKRFGFIKSEGKGKNAKYSIAIIPSEFWSNK